MYQNSIGNVGVEDVLDLNKKIGDALPVGGIDLINIIAMTSPRVWL